MSALLRPAWIAILLIGVSSLALANDRVKAARLYQRITGMPPSAATLQQLIQKLTVGDFDGAAQIAVTSEDFINSGAKRLVVPWTNQLANMQDNINYSASIMIGAIRDDIPFDQVLYSDFFYVGPDAMSSDVDPQHNRIVDTP